jgi:hypothetical protein
MSPRRFLFRLGTAAVALSLGLGLAGAAGAQTNDPSFRLNNRSNQTIMEVYVSSSADRNWGRDLLGADVLPAGRSLVIRLPAGQCVNDIRIVVDGGRPIERMQINTCNLTDINYP